MERVGGDTPKNVFRGESTVVVTSAVGSMHPCKMRFISAASAAAVCVVYGGPPARDEVEMGTAAVWGEGVVRRGAGLPQGRGRRCCVSLGREGDSAPRRLLGRVSCSDMLWVG